MGKKINVWKIDIVFVLAVFCLFAVSVLVVLIFGVNIYKNTVKKSQEGYDDRICLSYIWTKVKNNDTDDKVYADSFCGFPALYLEEELDGMVYRTIIYAYDGWLYELFCETGLDFAPEDGTPVIEVKSLGFEQMDGGLIKATMGAESIFISPRCGSGFSIKT